MTALTDDDDENGEGNGEGLTTIEEEDGISVYEFVVEDTGDGVGMTPPITKYKSSLFGPPQASLEFPAQFIKQSVLVVDTAPVVMLFPQKPSMVSFDLLWGYHILLLHSLLYSVPKKRNPAQAVTHISLVIFGSTTLRPVKAL